MDIKKKQKPVNAIQIRTNQYSIPLTRPNNTKSQYQQYSPQINRVSGFSNLQNSPQRKRQYTSFHQRNPIELLKPLQFKHFESPPLTSRINRSPYKQIDTRFVDQKLRPNISQIRYKLRDKQEYQLIHSIRSKKGFQLNNPNKMNQDQYAVLTNIGNKSYFNFYAVFDGHGMNGHFVSQFLKQQYPFQIVRSQFELQLFPKNRLQQIFQELSEKLRQSQYDIQYSGSTIISLLIIQDKIYCANLGDSRAIRIKKQDGDDNYTYQQLSRDHKPDQQDEAERIVNAGGRIEAFKDSQGQYTGPLRVWNTNLAPGLAMSRSMGDSAAESVGVWSVPEITEFELSSDDKIILLGSDGLFEFLSEQEIMDSIISYFEKDDLEGACENLMLQAWNSWNKRCNFADDITFILIFLKH